jgi:hypothetical protein
MFIQCKEPTDTNDNYTRDRNANKTEWQYCYHLPIWIYNSLVDIVYLLTILKKTLWLSPRANYTDRATAACRRSDCQLFADRGCQVVSVADPYGRILDFLDRSRYFSIK